MTLSMPIEPPEIPPSTPGHPTEPPPEEPPAGPRPEIPPPVREPGEAPPPDELPGRMPEELPVRGPNGPRTPSPATDAKRCDATNIAVSGGPEYVMNYGGPAHYVAQNKSESAFERRHNPA